MFSHSLLDPLTETLKPGRMLGQAAYAKSIKAMMLSRNSQLSRVRTEQNKLAPLDSRDSGLTMPKLNLARQHEIIGRDGNSSVSPMKKRKFDQMVDQRRYSTHNQPMTIASKIKKYG